MTNKSRILWADNLKGVLILLVILGHVLQYSCIDFRNMHLYNYIYSFHMPVFMAISGYLSFKPTGIARDWSRLKKRMIQLLFPYILWTPIFCLIVKESLYQFFFISPIYWFLILLFIINLLMTLCQWVANKLRCKSEYIAILQITILFFLLGKFKLNALSLGILQVHFLFYSLGWYIRKYDELILRKWMICPLVLFTIITGWFYVPNKSPSFLFGLPPSLYFVITGSLGTFSFFTLFRAYMNHKLHFLCEIGKMTLGVYVIHLVLCALLMRQIQQFTNHLGTELGVILLFVFITFVTIIVTILFGKKSFLRYFIGKN